MRGRRALARRRRLHRATSSDPQGPHRLRRPCRRARRQALRRPAPAHRHRPRAPQGRADPRARRGDQRARFGGRGGDPGELYRPDARQDGDRHRPPPLDHRRDGPAGGARRRPHRREGARTTSFSRRGGLYASLWSRQSGGFLDESMMPAIGAQACGGGGGVAASAPRRRPRLPLPDDVPARVRRHRKRRSMVSRRQCSAGSVAAPDDRAGSPVPSTRSCHERPATMRAFRRLHWTTSRRG